MNQTSQDFLNAAKEAVVEKYIYEDFNDPEKRDAFINEVCLLALTNQAEELRNESNYQKDITHSLTCPFCDDIDFNRVDLKFHLENYCPNYSKTPNP